MSAATPPNGDFIGAGWAFPAHVDPRGGVALVRGTDELDASLRMILETAPGERVMRPDFGCRIWEHMFDATDPTTLGLMAQAVRDAVVRWEPRVDLEDVTVRVVPDDPSVVRIDVAYRVRSTNDRRNLVHPFYMIPREEPTP
jgi:hypothetical protein